MEILLLVLFIALSFYVVCLESSFDRRIRRLNRRFRKLVYKYENLQKSEQARRNK